MSDMNDDASAEPQSVSCADAPGRLEALDHFVHMAAHDSLSINFGNDAAATCRYLRAIRPEIAAHSPKGAETQREAGGRSHPKSLRDAVEEVCERFDFVLGLPADTDEDSAQIRWARDWLRSALNGGNPNE